MRSNLVALFCCLVFPFIAAACDNDSDCGKKQLCVITRFDLRGQCIDSQLLPGVENSNPSKPHEVKTCREDSECNSGFVCRKKDNEDSYSICLPKVCSSEFDCEGMLRCKRESLQDEGLCLPWNNK